MAEDEAFTGQVGYDAILGGRECLSVLSAAAIPQLHLACEISRESWLKTIALRVSTLYGACVRGSAPPR